MDEYTGILLDELQQTDDAAEQHRIIVELLRRRPDVHRLMSAIIMQENQAEAATCCTELLKPNSGALS